MNDVEEAQDELLREAARSGNQIFKLKTADGVFVKVRRGYSHPAEFRELYMQALEALITSGKLQPVLKNKDFELYEISDLHNDITSLERAKEVLMGEIERVGKAYKIHSPDGEFVQVGTRSFCEVEAERILFLEALCELSRHAKVQIMQDSRELSRYEIRRPLYSFAEPEHRAAS